MITFSFSFLTFSFRILRYFWLHMVEWVAFMYMRACSYVRKRMYVCVRVLCIFVSVVCVCVRWVIVHVCVFWLWVYCIQCKRSFNERLLYVKYLFSKITIFYVSYTFAIQNNKAKVRVILQNIFILVYSHIFC